MQWDNTLCEVFLVLVGMSVEKTSQNLYIRLIYTRKGYFANSYAFSMVALADSKTKRRYLRSHETVYLIFQTQEKYNIRNYQYVASKMKS